VEPRKLQAHPHVPTTSRSWSCSLIFSFSLCSQCPLHMKFRRKSLASLLGPPISKSSAMMEVICYNVNLSNIETGVTCLYIKSWKWCKPCFCWHDKIERRKENEDNGEYERNMQTHLHVGVSTCHYSCNKYNNFSGITNIVWITFLSLWNTCYFCLGLLIWYFVC